MSARGASSRKVQVKDIEKKEKKVTGKGKAPEPIYETRDAFAEWRPTPSTNNSRSGISRSMTVSSNNSRATSRSNSTHDSSSQPRLNTLPSNDSSDVRSGHEPKSAGAKSASVSDISSTGRENAKYQAKGKETKAPRGRGGGVPIKRTVVPSPVPPLSRAESSTSYALPTQKTWINFKVWEGGKDGMRPYGGFDFDDDMQHGSVLIYFKEEQVVEDRPVPSIRAELEVLQNSGSTWLSNALLYGQIDDNDVDDWALSESAGSPSQHYSPNYPQPDRRRMPGPTSLGGRSPPPFYIDQTYTRIDSRAASKARHRSKSPPPFRKTHQRNPTHEIWFTAPGKIKTPQGQRLHHVAIRNFLAILHGKPIVGADLFDMLSTLQPEIQVMFDLDNDSQSRMTPRERSVQMITNYLGHHGIHDVRNNIRRALGILAWAEQDNVRWRQGYLESFVQLAGIMTQEIEDHADFKRLSVVTRRNLRLAGKTLQLRVMEAEEKLSSFNFSELWEDTSKAANSPVYQSYQNFRQFLISYYSRIYGSWPPSREKTWLNRKVAYAMQEDFGSLYDYFVDRDVIWNPREERASRKWEMAHRKNDTFTADLPEIGMTDMLVAYDAKYGYAHIPHPYPLLPREVPKASKDKEKKSFFSSLKKDKTKETTKDAKAHLQLSIVFSDATNIEKLDVNFNGTTLIDKFEQFELTTDLKNTTPREARLGRWVLLYGVLQVLSTISVDVQGLKHTDGVRYHLCADLKRMPEWVSNGRIEHLEASQQRSWCWQRAWDPMLTQTAPVELEATPSIDRNEYAPHHDNSHNTEVAGHSFPSPPPQQALPPPPSLDNATRMQNEFRRLGEKIDSFPISNNANSPPSRTEFERRRQNEPVIQDEFQRDRKPRLQGETFLPRIITNHISSSHTNNDNSFNPRMDSLPRHPNDAHPRTHSRQNTSFFFLPSDDFHDLPPAMHPKTEMRSHVKSVDTDLGAYQFSGREVLWPVPPGYSERESEKERERKRERDERRNPRGLHDRGGGN